jgi:hypothetical protein
MLKADALEIDIFYDDTRPLRGYLGYHLNHFAPASCSAATWVIGGLTFLKPKASIE